MAEAGKIVERAAEQPTNQRAIKPIGFLNRTLPNWVAPGYLNGDRWRQMVRNQPIAIICRDTLISNVMSMDWSIRQRETQQTKLKRNQDEIDHYTEVFNKAEGGFDNYCSMILQDTLDLPFGGMGEMGRLNDQPDQPVMWVEHVDGATLFPTNDPNWPVMQHVANLPGRSVVFPAHAINRVYMTPRPDLARKGWGMAPPEKIYLALEMLYRGDRYYANLLLDTPEAGLLDLIDMTQEDAEEWLDSWRDLMLGVDGFKVPVLYEHSTPAQWIPFNRPPIDMMYDATTIKYAAICAAGYGIQLSDIGLAESSGEKTLAGVIRGERQSRRTGRAEIRSRITDHLEGYLPDHLMFVFEEKDEEAKTEQARALSTYGLALGQLKRDGLLSPEEARQELVSTGLLDTEIDPNKVPEPEVPMGMPGQPTFQKPGKGKPFGKPTDEDRGKVSPTQGGRGDTEVQRTLVQTPPDIPGEPPYDDLVRRLSEIVAPSIGTLAALATRAGGQDYRSSSAQFPIVSAPRIRRLIKATVRAMLPGVKRTFDELDDTAIEDVWLPEMLAMDLDLPSELESAVLRQSTDELRAILDRHLEDDPWWKIASAWDKDAILDIFKAAYEVGLAEQAVAIIRALYEEGRVSTPILGVGLDFKLSNKRVLNYLERTAADLVANVNDGTKFFIKRIVVAGVREGMARPRIAKAIRDGIMADNLLKDEGFMGESMNEIIGAIQDMPQWRTESIVLTEVNRATNLGLLDQIVESGLKKKAWEHLGPRGVTKKGNPHPCPVCEANESLGFVDHDFLYPTVFKSGGPNDDGKELGPPAHPNVCHCRIAFDEKELFATVRAGTYAPYLGGSQKHRKSYP